MGKKEGASEHSNSAGFREAAFDSLRDIDIFFMQATGKDPEYVLRESNWVADSISANGSVLGVRFTWFSDDDNATPSASEQYKSLQDIGDFMTNARYLTFFPDEALDGMKGTHLKDASNHFTALSYWLNKDYLYIVDKFHETYIDSAWWDVGGTITANSGTLTIAPNSNIESKSAFEEATSRVVFQRTGTFSSTQELGVWLKGDSWVKLYAKNRIPYVAVKIEGQGPPAITQYSGWGTVTDTLHEFKLVIDGEIALFYIDGSYLTDEDFEVDPDMTLRPYTTSGNSSMQVDSASVISPDPATPQIRITDCSVDTVSGNPRPKAHFYCNSSVVKAHLTEYVYGSDQIKNLYSAFYNSGSYVTWGNVSYLMSDSYDSGYYRILLAATNAAGTDTVFANGFYWDKDSGTILASADEPVRAAPSLPRAFALNQNYPNPFNPSTTISYEIPENLTQVRVNINIFNIRGQLVKTLVDNIEQGPGNYSVSWNGLDAKGRKVPSGVYFYYLSAGDFTASRKMVILK